MNKYELHTFLAEIGLEDSPNEIYKKVYERNWEDIHDELVAKDAFRRRFPTHVSKPNPIPSREKTFKGKVVRSTQKYGLLHVVTLNFLEGQVETASYIETFTDQLLWSTNHKLEIYQKLRSKFKDEYSSLEGVTNSDRQHKSAEMGAILAIIKEVDQIIGHLQKQMACRLIEVYRNLKKCCAILKTQLVGRQQIKDAIAEIIYAFGINYRTLTRTFNNFVLFGAPGTGKTKIALVMAEALSVSGILARNRIKIATRTDMVASYLGQTGPKTRSVLYGSLEGVLFIDEAYQLSADSYGAEAITELVNFLDKHIGMSVTIAAGYKDRMVTQFLGSNEGMSRRFPRVFTLGAFAHNQLAGIFKKQLVETFECPLPSKGLTRALIDVVGVFPYQASDMLEIATKTARYSTVISIDEAVVKAFEDFAKIKLDIILG